MMGYSRNPNTGQYDKVWRTDKDGKEIWHQTFVEKLSEIETISAIPAKNIDWNPKSIPPRPWIFGNRALRKQVNVLAAIGGAGKTVFVGQAVLSLATGHNLFDLSNTDPVFKLHLGQQRVYYYSLEDDLDEVRRRTVAQMTYFGISSDNLDEYLWIGDGTADRLILAAMDRKTGDIVRGACVDTLIAFLIDKGIAVLVLDPFVKSHGCGENDNQQMDRVMTLLKEIAIAANCGIWLVHHSGKAGSTFDANGSRGASAITWAARVSETMESLGFDECKKYNLEGNLVRLSPTKVNLSERSMSATRVLRITGHPVDNATPLYPDGDYCQVMTVVDVKPVVIDEVLFRAICDVIRTPPATGAWLSDKRHASYVGIAFRQAGIQHDHTCQTHVEQWVKDGLIIPDADARGAQNRLIKTGVKLNEVMARQHLETHFGQGV